MKIRADLLRTRHAVAADGSRLEPEQQPMDRVMVTEFAAGMQGGPQVGTIRGEIVTQSSAGEIASAMRHPCFSCKHFNQHAWKALFNKWTDPGTPISERNQLNAIRAALLTTKNASIHEAHTGEDGDVDVEHALMSLGLCEPLTEMSNQPTIVYPTAGCPDEYVTPQQPNAFYKAKDRENERMGSAVFDNVMRLAMGKR